MTDNALQNKEWVLTAEDRCDMCSAQAYVKVTGVSGDLTFCSHHYNSIINDSAGYEKMMSFMFEIIDERDKLIDNKTKGQDY
jgi:hypothetical protein